MSHWVNSTYSSPFISLLHTNIAPSEHDCHRIQTFLAGPQQDAAALSQEIVRVQKFLNELIRRRDELTSFIDSHISLLSPARRLPEDIIRAIFVSCSSGPQNATMSSREAPLVLCQICSAWRLLALATPPLWASIHIIVLRRSAVEDLADTVIAWLSRSGTLPLSISLCSESRDSDLSPLLASLALFSSRWEYIDIIPLRFESFKSYSHLSADDVPTLKSVFVGRSSLRDLGALCEWGFLSLLNTSTLRSISILNGNNLSTLQLPWTRLTHVVLTGQDPWWHLSIYRALMILRQCTRLEACHLTISKADDRHLNLAPILLPCLHRLEVDDIIGYIITENFFAKLLLPNLRCVKYTLNQDAVDASSPPSPIFLPFLVFVPSLETLSLSITGMLSDDLIRALPLMPRLTALELHGEPTLQPPPNGWPVGPCDADFLTQLAPALCPNLSDLRLSKFRALSDDTLLYFIQAHALRLTNIVAQFERKMQRDILQPLEPLIVGGLGVSLEYVPPK